MTRKDHKQENVAPTQSGPRVNVGLIERVVDASLGTSGSATDYANCTQIGSAMGQSIPFACQDWANIKAAYRFFSNEADILAGHFQATLIASPAEGLVLVLHDTTEFNYQREKSEAIGITKSINSRRDKAGRLRSHTVCGILMHSSLAVTLQGIPLALPAVKENQGNGSA